MMPEMPDGGAAAGYAATVASPGPSPQAATVQCPRCSAATPASFSYCQQCGLHLQAVAPTDPGGAVRAGSIGPSSGPTPTPTPVKAPSPHGNRGIDPQGATLAVPGEAAAGAAGTWGAAVLVNRDGSDGETFALSGEFIEVGRAGVGIAFEQDRFLARTHARLERSASGVRIVCLDTLNGVFRKLDQPAELVDGAVLLVGREVLRYESVDPDEREAAPLVQHGVALFGSPPRAPWGRLRALLPSGGTRDIRYLHGDEIVIGREEGDLVYRDDAFLSRRHAALTWDGQRAQLTDLGSSNGTFLRLVGTVAIRHHDHLRMGDQLFRIELR